MAIRIERIEIPQQAVLTRRLSASFRGVRSASPPLRHSGTRLLARARNDGKLCRPREGACEGNGFRSYTFFATERVANAGGVREPIPRSAQCIRSSAVRSIPLCSNQTFDQAALACNRYAAIRLLASACHSATALALIRPRTGRNPKPWFLRWALIRSMSFRSL